MQGTSTIHREETGSQDLYRWLYFQMWEFVLLHSVTGMLWSSLMQPVGWHNKNMAC